MSINSNKVVIVFGPTAVGKTAFINSLALAPLSDYKSIMLVSADSVQVYKGLDIGSAKPSIQEQESIEHRLIDILPPEKPFSVADFVYEADIACKEAIDKNLLPVISGGTAYYIKAFIYGLAETPPAQPEVRALVQKLLQEKGTSHLLDELRRVDPSRAAQLSPNDIYRISRSLEVCISTGKKMSDFALPTKPRSDWNCLVVGLDRPRHELYARIDARVEAMFDAGLEKEVANLLEAGYGKDSPAMKAIGYAEFLSDEPDIEKIKNNIKQNSRNYAKRQLTFMRHIDKVNWFNADNYAEIYDKVFSWLSSPS